MKSRLVHVSADFPDDFVPGKTPVVRALVDLVDGEFEQSVISLNRVSPKPLAFAGDMIRSGFKPQLSIETEPFAYGKLAKYFAPPKGIFHANMLGQLGDWIASELDKSGPPDLLIGHKLTVEGIAVRKAAGRFGIPFGLSIQGNTDTKILDARPDLHRELAKVFHEAAVVFPFSPWALDRFEAVLGTRSGRTHMLPCPTDLDQPIVPRPDGDGLISVFHLKNHRGKNLQGMADGLSILETEGSAPRLTIVGGGSVSDTQNCKAITKDLTSLTFAGPLDRLAVRNTMNRATGFIMPSLRESFGLVFVEALFAGLPIAYPANTAVDGYFDGLPFAIRTDPRDPAAIARAMRTLVEDEASLKAQLAEWQHSEMAKKFTRPAIGRVFGQAIRQAIAGE